MKRRLRLTVCCWSILLFSETHSFKNRASIASTCHSKIILQVRVTHAWRFVTKIRAWVFTSFLWISEKRRLRRCLLLLQQWTPPAQHLQEKPSWLMMRLLHPLRNNRCESYVGTFTCCTSWQSRWYIELFDKSLIGINVYLQILQLRYRSILCRMTGHVHTTLVVAFLFLSLVGPL